MLVCAEVRPLDQDELTCRKRSLRDAVICVGWMKFVSIIGYVILYFMVHVNSNGSISIVIQIMTIVVVPLQAVHGILLFLGALEEKKLALDISIWLCLLIASYNTVLGALGGIYFLRTGFLTMHFILAVIFTLLIISLFAVLCHDILIIFAYKKIISCN